MSLRVLQRLRSAGLPGCLAGSREILSGSWRPGGRITAVARALSVTEWRCEGDQVTHTGQVRSLTLLERYSHFLVPLFPLF